MSPSPARAMLGWVAAWIAGIALFEIFPGANLVRFLGAMLIAGATLVLLLAFVRYVVRSFRRDGLSVKNALFGVLIAVVVAFLFVRIAAPHDESEIEETIETVALSTDPTYCAERVTDRYLLQITGSRPPYADDTCRHEAESTTTDAVQIGDIGVDGDRATALVTYRGGGFDGSTVRVALVEEDGTWMLDRIVAFERFDRRRLDAAYARGLLRSGSSTVAVDCILGAARRLSTTELERLLLAGPERTAYFANLSVECDRPTTERNLIQSAVASAGIEFPVSVADCVERRAGASGDDRLARLSVDPRAYARLLYGCDPEAPIAAQERYLRERDLSPAAARCVLKKLRGMPPAGLIALLYDRDRYLALIDACEG